MGTYVLKPDTVSLKSAGSVWTTTPGGSTANADLVSAMATVGGQQVFDNIGALNPFSHMLRFNTKYYLDGSGTPTEFNNLPAGFTLDTVIAKVVAGTFDTLNRGYLQFNQATESPSFNTSGTKIFVWPDLTKNPISIGLNGVGIRLERDTGGGIGTPSWDFSRVEGDYSLQAFSWTLPSSSVESGDEVTITGNNGLENIEEICIAFGGLTICTSNFIKQSPTSLTFVIPSGVNFSGIIYVTANLPLGESVFVGSLTYVFENASGIYTLIKNKTNDTLYDGIRDGTTRNVKIPNPFIKTGYVGS
jgi:hypothetical protein